MIIAILLAVMLCGCKNTSSSSQEHSSEEGANITAPIDNTSFPSIIEARQAVIDKWKSSNKAFECVKFIEDVYKQYYSDDTITNIYYYCMAKEQYEKYCENPENDSLLNTAKENAIAIDPYYKGELADEIRDFVDRILPDRDEEAQKRLDENKEHLTPFEKYIREERVKLNNIDVQYNMSNKVDKKFTIVGTAEIDDYYNYGFDYEIEWQYFCAYVIPENGSYDNAWYVYCHRDDYNELFNLLKKGKRYVEMVCVIPENRYESGQGNLAELAFVSY